MLIAELPIVVVGENHSSVEGLVIYLEVGENFLLFHHSPFVLYASRSAFSMLQKDRINVGCCWMLRRSPHVPGRGASARSSDVQQTKNSCTDLIIRGGVQPTE